MGRMTQPLLATAKLQGGSPSAHKKRIACIEFYISKTIYTVA
ncbi:MULTISPECIES: hypothetical protein [Bacillaceae]|nr:MULTISPECIES: hypothetical protein [Bacillaceae]